MTVMLEKLKLMGFAEETVPGVCEDTGINYIGVFNKVYAPEFLNEVQNLNLSNLGNPRYFSTARRPIITFSTYIRGAGIPSVPETPPADSFLYKAAGMQETITTGVSVGYQFTPNKNLWKWLSARFWYCDGGNDYCIKTCGGMLTGVLRWEPGKPGIINWRYEGVFYARADIDEFYEDAASPAINKALIDYPVPPQSMNSDLLIASYQPVSNLFEIDMGNNINTRPDFKPYHGHREPYISRRNTTGTLQCEIPNVADYDIQGDIVNMAQTTFSISVGNDPGNRYTCALDAQIIGLSESANDGISGWNLNLGAVSEDDTDFSLIFT
jgi:hypothetical protein